MYQPNFPNPNPNNYGQPVRGGQRQQQVINQLIMRPVPGTGPPPGSGPAQGAPTTARLEFLSPSDQTKFEQLFAGGSMDGLRIGGDAARDILQRSKQPTPVLARIWTLADTRNVGSLTFPEFALAMYLTSLVVQGKSLPTQVPPNIRDEVQRAMNAPGGMVRSVGSSPNLGGGASAGGFGGMGPGPQSMALALPGQMPPQQPMGGAGMQMQMPQQATSMSYGSVGPSMGAGMAGQPQQFMPASSSAASVPWAVTPEEKAAYDQVFSAWDTRGTGFIAGETARAVFSQSGLGQTALAQIWQLSDLNNHGKLNADEFAVAMHLVHCALAGKPIPHRLTPDLVPPSTRDLSDSVAALKSSLAQDIVQQRHMSAAYSGTRFA
ncbi:hypothetical protein THASP1DRAFT_30641, partial [Thamnocephalis sphaerospora]